MKHSMKIIIIELALIISSFLGIIIFSYNYFVYLALLLALSIVIYFSLKPERRNERFNTDILLIIIITFLFYYAITYFLGFFAGFYFSNYSKQIKGILLNIIMGITSIYSIETIREVLIKNHAYHKSIVWLTPVICFLLEIPVVINFKLYSSILDIFSAILTVLIPSLVKNIVLTYITYKSDKKNSMAYQAIYTFPRYILPVFPNLGDFFDIIINTSLPIVMLILITNISTVKFEKIKNSRNLAKNKIVSRTINATIAFILITMIYLTSNMFRFTSLAIGSQSMTGTINKGDIVIIDKKDKKVKKNDIIAFKQQEKIIVHRMIGTKLKNNVEYYQTKGDANKSKDGWLLTDNDIVGKVKLRIRWLGWPTIALSELLQGIIL